MSLTSRMSVRVFGSMIAKPPKESYTFEVPATLSAHERTAFIRKRYPTLNIMLRCAKNLEAQDFNGYSDPYVVFHYGTRKLQSTTKKKTLNPQWDEAFEFSIDESTFTGKKKPDHIRVEVWNWNLLSKDSLLGYGEIKFADLIRDARLPVSITLEGVQQGELELEVIAFNFGKEEEIVLDHTPPATDGSNNTTAAHLSAPSHHAARYKKTRLIFSGGQGHVYEAHDSKTNATVALKTIICKTFNEANTALQEVWPIRQLHHENIVEYRDVFFDQSQTEEGFAVCFVLEYFPEGDLLKLLKRRAMQNKPLSIETLKKFIYQIASGLAYVHENGIIHRDLKTQNVFIKDNYSTLLIADFGMALQTSSDDSLSQVCGTFEYLAPEVSLGKTYSLPADVFSCGVIFYELITLQLGKAHHVYINKNETAYEKEIRHDLFQVIGNQLPEWIELIVSMLRLDPLERPTAAQVLEQV